MQGLSDKHYGAMQRLLRKKNSSGARDEICTPDSALEDLRSAYEAQMRILESKIEILTKEKEELVMKNSSDAQASTEELLKLKKEKLNSLKKRLNTPSRAPTCTSKPTHNLREPENTHQRK